MRGRNPSADQGRDRRRAAGAPVLDELENPGSAASDKSRGLGRSPMLKNARRFLISFPFERRHAVRPENLEPAECFPPALHRAPFFRVVAQRQIQQLERRLLGGK
jgi:hypothetical protein